MRNLHKPFSAILILAILFVAVTVFATSTAWAQRVTGYDPTMVTPTELVVIQGTDLGRVRDGRILKYGTGTAALGEIRSIRRWTDTEIWVPLPELPSATYWLAVYDAEGRLLSNQLRRLRVLPARIVRTPLVVNHALTNRATTVYTRLEAGGGFFGLFCGVDRRGFGLDPYMVVERVTVGHLIDYDPGGGPFPCWTWSYHSAQGAAMFDAHALGDPGRGRPSRIELIFHRPPDSDDCDTPLVRIATEDWPGGVNMVSSHTASERLDYDHYFREEQRFTIDLTTAVHRFLDAGRTFHGFVLTTAEVIRPAGLRAFRRAWGRTELHAAGPYGCMTQYDKLRLRLTW